MRFKIAISNLNNGKVGGLDTLCPEAFTMALSVELVPILTILFNKMFKAGKVPSQWKDVIISILFKKGDKLDCNNYRGISLINVIGKLYERLLQNRILRYCEETEDILPDNQFGFRANRSTEDAIFMSRFVASSARDLNVPLYQIYVDLVKTYDKVNRELLWHILKLRGFPPKIIAAIKSLLMGIYLMLFHLHVV